MSLVLSIRRLRAGWRRVPALDRLVYALLLLCIVWRVVGAPLPFQTAAGLLLIAAVVYLMFRLIAWIRARFLWRLRSRLIVAYVLIAVVPLVLVAAMVSLGSYLLYLQIGAHLLTDELNQRIITIAADTDAIGGAIQREVEQGADPHDRAILDHPRVAGLISALETEWPGLVVRPNAAAYLLQTAGKENAAGKQNFRGLVEFRNRLSFAAAQSRDLPTGSINLLVVAPLNSAMLDRFTPELGPITLTLLTPASEPVPGRQMILGKYIAGQTISSVVRVLPPAAHWFDFPVHGLSTFQAIHVERRTSNGFYAPVLASFTLRPFAVSQNLLSSVGAIGPRLVEIIIAAGVVFLVLEIVALATGIVLTRTITGAVAGLYDATLHVRRGDFSHRIRIQHRDQLAALGESFNEMTSSLSELIEDQRQHQRLENEVSIAREVQRQLFPRELPSVPGLQLAAICRPARVVSGDYYDFIRLGPTRVAMALADISGKGISAALLMASLQAALRSAAVLDGDGSTAPLVARLNQHLFRNSSDDRYATLFYAVYDTESKLLTYTNAGHLAPFFIYDGKVQPLDEGGTVVGLFENPLYQQRTISVAPGSTLVAFSDGLTEPQNVYGEEFGVNRLREEVLRQSKVSVRALAEDLIGATERWAGSQEQADDLTVGVARMG